jgi:hypothetical protein
MIWVNISLRYHRLFYVQFRGMNLCLEKSDSLDRLLYFCDHACAFLCGSIDPTQSLGLNGQSIPSNPMYLSPNETHISEYAHRIKQ